MIVPLAFFIIAWSFPIYLNQGAKARELDAYNASNVGTADGAVDPDSKVAREKDIEASHFELKA